MLAVTFRNAAIAGLGARVSEYAVRCKDFRRETFIGICIFDNRIRSITMIKYEVNPVSKRGNILVNLFF